MIAIVCDQCTHRFEVGDDQAGRMVPCPNCKYVNAVPARVSAGNEPGPAPTEIPGHRPLSAEKPLMRVRPAMFRARPALFSGLALLVLSGVVGAGYFIWQKQYSWAMVCGLPVLAGVAGLVVWKIRTLAVTLEVTSRRTMAIRGLFSKATTEVLHDNVSNLQITQSFWNRVWGVGQIGISSAGQDEVEIVVRDLPDPFKIRETIDRHRTA